MRVTDPWHFRVRAMCHNRTLPNSPRLESFHGSIEQRESVAAALEGVTHVLHLATVKETPDAALGDCVAAAVKKVTFPKTQKGGSFTYPQRF